MANWKKTVVFAVMLGCMVMLAGCEDKKSKEDLSKADLDLKKVQEEKEALGAKGQEMEGMLKAATDELDSVKAASDELTDQVTVYEAKISELEDALVAAGKLEEQMTAQRDAAVAEGNKTKSTIEQLTAQLKEQVEKVATLQGEIEGLKSQVKKLIGSATEVLEAPAALGN